MKKAEEHFRCEHISVKALPMKIFLFEKECLEGRTKISLFSFLRFMNSFELTSKGQSFYKIPGQFLRFQKILSLYFERFFVKFVYK